MKDKKSYLKYAMIALVIVFLVTAAFLGIKIWEKHQGKYTGAVIEDGVLSYNDEEYVYKQNLETFLVLGLDKYEGASDAESHESGVQADFSQAYLPLESGQATPFANF